MNSSSAGPVILAIVLVIYGVSALAVYSSEPQLPSGSGLGLVKAFMSIDTFSFAWLPYPLNILVSFVVGAFFALGLVLTILELARVIGEFIPG